MSIPLQNPDLNPICFYLMAKAIKEDTWEKYTTRETLDELSQSIWNIIVNYVTEKIDKIIESMGKLVKIIIAAKENCI